MQLLCFSKSKNILYISEMWTFNPLLIHKVQYIYLLDRVSIKLTNHIESLNLLNL